MKAEFDTRTLTLTSHDGTEKKTFKVSEIRNLPGDKTEVTFLVKSDQKPIVAEVDIAGAIRARHIEDSAAMMEVFGDKEY